MLIEDMCKMYKPVDDRPMNAEEKKFCDETKKYSVQRN